MNVANGYGDPQERIKQLEQQLAKEKEAREQLEVVLRWAMHYVPRPVNRIKGQNEAYCDSYERAEAVLALAQPEEVGHD